MPAQPATARRRAKTTLLWTAAAAILAAATVDVWLPQTGIGMGGRPDEIAAREAAARGKRAEAFQAYRRCAIRGNAACQRELALCYLYGRGTASNAEKAIGWLVHSYEKGNAESAALIGRLLLTGEHGVHPNRRYALEWLKKAHESGVPVASKLIGDAYRYGWGVKKNWETASYWYTQSSLAGCPEADDAMHSLSRLMWPDK